jgi:hypothetical protein
VCDVQHADATFERPPAYHKAWTVADSMCLNPVSWGVTMEKKMYYMGEIAKLQA